MVTATKDATVLYNGLGRALGMEGRAADGSGGGMTQMARLARIALWGDSRKAQHVNAKGGTLNSLQGYAHVAQKVAAAAGAYFEVPSALNFGVSGERTDQWIKRAEDVIESEATHVILGGFLNDLDTGKNPSVVDQASAYAAAATAVGNIVAAARKVASAGVLAIVETDIPVLGWNEQYRRNAIAYGNELLRQHVANMAGVVLFDVAALAIDPADATYKPVAAWIHPTDNTHWSYFGAFQLGKALAPVLMGLVPRYPAPMCRSVADVAAVNPLQVMPNPLWATAAGGTVTAPITGAAPAFVNVSRAGSGSALTAAVATEAGTYGNKLRADITFSAAGEDLRIGRTLYGGAPFANDIAPVETEQYRLEGLVEVSGSALRLQTVKVYLEVKYTDSPTTNQAMDGNVLSGEAGSAVPEDFAYPVQTPWLTLEKNRTVEFIQWQVRPTGRAAGAATVKLSQFRVVKRVA